jgi:type II secretory pathway component PulF
MFDTLGVEVPASTRALMGLADLGKSYWYLIVLGVAAGVGGLYFLIRDDRGQQFASNVQIRIPVVGHLVVAAYSGADVSHSGHVAGSAGGAAGSPRPGPPRHPQQSLPKNSTTACAIR